MHGKTLSMYLWCGANPPPISLMYMTAYILSYFEYDHAESWISDGVLLPWADVLPKASSEELVKLIYSWCGDLIWYV